jgi:hypothetical protein
MRHFTRPRWRASSAALVVLLRVRLWDMPLALSRRPAHCTSRISESTVGTILRRFRVAKVLVWSSEMLAGGGVPGGCTSKEEEECLRP